MSHNRQAHATHTTITTVTSEDIPSPTADGLFTDIGQPPSHHHLPSPSLRSSQPNSTLADSIRALREHKFTTASGTKVQTYIPTTSSTSPSDPSSTFNSLESLANRRKASKPSPLLQQNLQTSNSSKLHGRPDLHSPLSPRSLHSFALPPLDLPSSPKERIEALLALQSASSIRDNTRLGAVPRKTSDSSILLQTRSYALQQSHSPLLYPMSPQAGVSPPLSPSSTISALPTKLPKIMSMMPRTSSIDSTVSSMSSNTTASQATRQNSSISKGATEPESEFDAASFVAQAGSVEIALQSLWKDKQNTANHNTQLWRLVEKQRAVLLGLQKDMDKAFKERDRYRKRLKEHLASCASSTTSLAPSDVNRTAASPSPAPSEAVSEFSKTPGTTPVERTPLEGLSPGFLMSPSGTALTTPRPSAHHYKDSETLGDLSSFPTHEVEEKRQTAIHLRQANPQSPMSPIGTSSNHTSLEASPMNSTHGGHSLERLETPLTEPSLAPEMSPIEGNTPHQLPETKGTPGNSAFAPTLSPPLITTAVNPPTFAITNPTPVIDAGSFPTPPKPSATSRKPIPAPLTLAQSNLSPAHDKPHFDTSSPVIAIRGDADFVPDAVERGRRRTRQDDELVREVIALKEEEARSLSMKSKSKTTTPLSSPILMQHASAQTLTTVTISGPQSPQLQMIPPSPRLPVNMSALLSPALSDSSTRVNRNSVMVPPVSPGLPMSPRPTHRPANSAQPRELNSQMETLNTAKPLVPLSASEPVADTSSLRVRATPLVLGPPPARSALIAQKRASALPAPLFSRKQQTLPEAVPAQASSAQEASPHPLPAAQPSVVPRRPIPTRTGSTESAEEAYTIYQGFKSEQYPNLLMTPNALPLIEVKVVSSRMRPSRNSIMMAIEEDPVFLLGVYSRADGKQLWRVEKNLQTLIHLHDQIREVCSLDIQVPDATLFQGHAPAKIDARREALDRYLGFILDQPLIEDAAVLVCKFFSTDALEPEKEASVTVVNLPGDKEGVVKSKILQTREGYLTKRGKNFGGWKARYFVLDGPELKYYDTLGGPQIGVIRLFRAQIGKQSNNRSNESPMGRGDDDNQYRHAFLVLEPKKKDSSSLVRHVLCAESDEERDAWVEACLGYVNVISSKDKLPSQSTANRQEEVTSRDPESYLTRSSVLPPSQSSNRQNGNLRIENSREVETPSPVPAVRPGVNYRNTSSTSNPFLARVDEDHVPRSQSRAEAEESQTLGMSYESTVQAEAPTMGTYQNNGNSPSPNTTTFPRNTPTMQQKEFTISGPTNGARISDMASWGLKASNGVKTPAKEKKRSIFGFASRARSSSDLIVNAQAKEASPARNGPGRATPLRSVFGMPIAEAVELCPPEEIDAHLPAVVYRSIEYLRAMEAVDEEGIFRLSGSNVTIKNLRERFSQEGDVDLMDGEYCDVHAVASLLKLYLRELPQSVLTRDLHMQFLDINALNEHQKKVKAANVLVHKLPKANFHLLEALCSFLGDVVKNSDKNKMNVRNVGIVFAPTLNIAAWLISLLVTDFNGIFGDAYPEELSPIREVMVNASEPADSLRSPRHQVFGDLPTPTPSQTNFPHDLAGFAPMSTPAQHRIQSRTTYVPLGPQMHSQPGSRKQPPPVGPQHLQTQPHNEWAGPSHGPISQTLQQPQLQQHLGRRSHLPSFPHPSALGIGPVEHAASQSTNGSPQIGYATSQKEGQTNLGAGESRRNRRESAMMGGEVGFFSPQPPQRQPIGDTGSSRQAPQPSIAF